MKKKIALEVENPKQEIDFNKVFCAVRSHYQAERSLTMQTQDDISFCVSFNNPTYGVYCMQVEEDIIVGLVRSEHHRHIYSDCTMTAEQIFAETCKEVDAILAEKLVQIILYGRNNIVKKNDLHEGCEIEHVIERAQRKRLFPCWQIYKVRIISYRGTLDREIVLDKT